MKKLKVTLEDVFGERLFRRSNSSEHSSLIHEGPSPIIDVRGHQPLTSMTILRRGAPFAAYICFCIVLPYYLSIQGTLED